MNINTQQLVRRIRKMQDHEVHKGAEAAAQRERDSTIEVLHFLAEVDRRKLYFQHQKTSLWAYCRFVLKFSEGATSRRISSMKLLREVPEIEAKVESGELNLTTLSQASTFFNQEEKVSYPKAPDEKREVLKALESKSTFDVQDELLRRSSAPTPKGKDKARKLTDRLTQVSFVLDPELRDEIEAIRGLLAHRHPKLSWGSWCARWPGLS